MIALPLGEELDAATADLRATESETPDVVGPGDQAARLFEVVGVARVGPGPGEETEMPVGVMVDSVAAEGAGEGDEAVAPVAGTRARIVTTADDGDGPGLFAASGVGSAADNKFHVGCPPTMRST